MPTMTIAINVAFQGMPPSPALRSEIERCVEKLARFATNLQRCDVTVRLAQNRHHQGNGYRVHAHLALPGGDLDAVARPHAEHSHDDPYLAVRDVFDALRRQLEDTVRIRRGDVKFHSNDAKPSSS
jgi:ribosomal subunit interface protein